MPYLFSSPNCHRILLVLLSRLHRSSQITSGCLALPPLSSIPESHIFRGYGYVVPHLHLGSTQLPTALSNSRCVSRFNFSALLLTFHHHASGRSKEISQHKSKSATTQNLTQPTLLTEPVALHAPIVQINIRTRDNRAHSGANYPSIVQVLTIALTVSLAAGRGAQ